MSTGIVTFDEQLRIQTFNSAATRMFGMSSAATHGNSLAALLSPLSLPPLQTYVRNSVSQHRQGDKADVEDTPVLEREVVGLRSTGESFPLLLTVNLVRGGKEPQ